MRVVNHTGDSGDDEDYVTDKRNSHRNANGFETTPPRVCEVGTK